MKLIVGLGNVGATYDYTRHNVGFLAVDIIANVFAFPAYKRFEECAVVSMANIGSHRVLLTKPTTLMNRSGFAVRRLSQFYKIGLPDIIVIQDDLDMQFLKLRVRTGGSDGGHNGIKSITNLMASDQYTRIKMGIGRPENPEQDSASYVLSNFTKPQLEVVQQVGFNIASNITLVLDGKISEFQSKTAGITQ